MLINATGQDRVPDRYQGSKSPTSSRTNDSRKEQLRQIWIRRGVKNYTYALSRLDSTCILSSIKAFGPPENAH